MIKAKGYECFLVAEGAKQVPGGGCSDLRLQIQMLDYLRFQIQIRNNLRFSNSVGRYPLYQRLKRFSIG